METLADVVGDLTDPERPAVRADRVLSAREVRTRAYKTGNALRHRGVRSGATLAVLDDGGPNPLFCLFGSGLLGATVEFDPEETVDARALAGPTQELGAYDLPAGGQRVGWGASPSDPSWMYFERDVWSENPAFPEHSVGPDDELLPGQTHGTLVAAAERVAADLNGEDRVAVRAPLAHPGTIVSGVVAPLLAGASILLPGAATGADSPEGTVAVATGGAPERRVLDPDEAAP